jgi:hypothetical protein
LCADRPKISAVGRHAIEGDGAAVTGTHPMLVALSSDLTNTSQGATAMRRIAYLTIPLGILLGLTIGTSGANAGGYKHSNCEQRIFQEDEDAACFASKDGIYVFQRRVLDEAALISSPSTSSFSLSGPDGRYECGCQLRRKYDVICAGDGALIASTERRGRWISGESYGSRLTTLKSASGQQVAFLARRIDLEKCRAREE